MTRRGYALRLGGDVEIRRALGDGVTRGTEAARRRAHGDEAVRRVAMMRHTPEEWATMIAQAQYDYGQDAPMPRWAERLTVGYALICYALIVGFSALFRAVDGRDER